MGFLSGSVTFERFRVTSDPTGAFGEEHLEKLKKRKIKSTDRNLYESPSIGFVGGVHLLDTGFSFEKNIIGDALHFGIRVDSCQIPGPVKRAWTHIELAGIMNDNSGGRPSKVQREQAQEAVEALCAAEAEKGNFTRMAVTPVLWDAVSETVYLGSTSEKSNDACLNLLAETFGLEFSKVTSGKLALEFADAAESASDVRDATPAPFHHGSSGNVVWWNGMQGNFDFLGNEFLTWLWWNWDVNGDVIELPDGSEVSGMFARSLSLDCPAGEHGKETISSESPVELPEAMLAIRMGKLPRKAGLTLVRNGEQYDFALQSEMFSVGSLRIRQIGDDADTLDAVDRVESIRQMAETLDLLFDVFCQTRFGRKWASSLKSISNWLALDSRSSNPRSERAA